MIKKESIKAYALKNAIEHEGEATQGPVINSLFNEGLKKGNIKSTIPIIQKILEEVNKLSINHQKQKLEKLTKYIGQRKTREGKLPPLKNTKKFKSRMSPSPSGPLHIGHALAILPNFLYAQKYKGQFYIRIEDTNPDNIYKPAYKMIEEEAKWLCNNKVKFLIQSERMELYYKTAKTLIEKNQAYVCTCDPEDFKNLLLKQKACPCRSSSFKCSW